MYGVHRGRHDHEKLSLVDKDIEQVVQSSHKCQQERPSPPPAPLHPWSWPTRPWTRLHIDFAGLMEGKVFLVVIDAHSKWIEVIPMTTATAELTSCLTAPPPAVCCQTMAPSLLPRNSASCVTSMEWNTFELHHTFHHPMVLLKEQCKSSSKASAIHPPAHWVIALPTSCSSTTLPLTLPLEYPHLRC